ncbi:MAG TPA: tRNA (adenosine(37)-N6)-threonylcarbamoyltransferase complex ATPase subunit type 1 TsaE [Syntrophobacteria bacterium]|nr:tRNA (adenosine(37)-N6)-threonylcarbamoyltransferase complex ATPase subunit type 1 TsaE [Syntrophobacteria bacterium]
MISHEGLQEWTIETSSPEETLLVAEHLGRRLEPGDVIALIGELGSGKTVFAQGLARGLEVPAAFAITSPTFTLVNEYPGRLPFYHLDLYRIDGPAQCGDLGLDELLYGEGAAAIEWAERLGAALPGERMEVHLIFTGETGRRLQFHAFGGRMERVLAALKALGTGRSPR